MTKKKSTPSKSGKKSGKIIKKKAVNTKEKKVILPKEIRGMLGKKNAKLVVFERDAEKIPVLPKDNKEINITIAHSQLDFYSSPHIINLSRYKAIEKTPPPLVNKQLDYRDLPGGKILSKFKIFDFFILENSEILKSFIKLPQLFRFNRPQFLGQLNRSQATIANKKLSPVRNLSIVNLFIFAGSQLVRSYQMIIYGFKILNLKAQYSLAKDEILEVRGAEPQNPYLVEAFRNTQRDWTESKAIPNRNETIPKLRYSVRSPFVLNLKGVAIFAAICLAVFMPFMGMNYYNQVVGTKGQVLGETATAIDDLSSAKDSLASFDLATAKDKFNKAGEEFVSAQGRFAQIKSILTFFADILPINNSYKSGKNVLEMGKRISFAGAHLSQGLDELSKSKSAPLAYRIKTFRQQLDESFSNLQIANDSLKKISDSDIPSDKLGDFNLLKQYLPVAIGSINKLQSLFDLSLGFLGENDLRRYLVVFQNDNEIRPTGGFIGSFALVDIKSGKIDNITMPEGGTYVVNDQLTELWKAPRPLTIINPKWQLQDSNWWPDYPTSAENIIEFYNKSGGPTVDGVIAINSSWLGEVLKVTGPIELKDYGKTIDASNFEFELQKSIELEAKAKDKPKKILAEMSPILISKIFNTEAKKIPDLATAFIGGLGNKDILIYLRDQKLEKIIADNGWSGSLRKSPGDYLNVVYANIGGGKTDAAINQNIYHKASVADDGTIIDKVLVERVHIGPLDNIFTNKANREFVRFYVPKGSELISAEGFDAPGYGEYKSAPSYLSDNVKLGNEKSAKIDPQTSTYIYDEGDYTVFGNWVTINPGTTKESALTYKLPFKANNKYQLLFQKQSGLRNVKISTEVAYPKSWKISDSGGNINVKDGKATYNSSLDGDGFYWINFKD